MEQKRIDKKNLLVILAVIVVIAVVAIVAATQKKTLNPTLGTLEADATATPVAVEVTATPVAVEATATPAAAEATATPAAAEANATPETTAVPEAAAEPASTEAAPETNLEPAKAFLVVQVAGAMYEPIPLYEEGRYTIRRGDLVNTIEVTTDSIKMHESSCDNQDCVEQGVVSLENRSKRVLQNMIICLPNEVVLELYTPEEIAQLLLSMAGYAGEVTHE